MLQGRTVAVRKEKKENLLTNEKHQNGLHGISNFSVQAWRSSKFPTANTKTGEPKRDGVSYQKKP
jgi:hypothetical protein